MDEDLGAIIAGFLILAAVIAVVYCLFIFASMIAATGAAGGVLWGGGTAIANYGLSFKENMIDSNKATI